MVRKLTEVTCVPVTPQSTVFNQGTTNAEAQLPHQENGVAIAVRQTAGHELGGSLAWLPRGHIFTLGRGSVCTEGVTPQEGLCPPGCDVLTKKTGAVADP